jgi:hypothetical protein
MVSEEEIEFKRAAQLCEKTMSVSCQLREYQSAEILRILKYQSSQWLGKPGTPMGAGKN